MYSPPTWSNSPNSFWCLKLFVFFFHIIAITCCSNSQFLHSHPSTKLIKNVTFGSIYWIIRTVSKLLSLCQQRLKWKGDIHIVPHYNPTVCIFLSHFSLHRVASSSNDAYVGQLFQQDKTTSNFALMIV